MNYLPAADQQKLAARYKFTSLIVVMFGVTVVAYLLIGRVIALTATHEMPVEWSRGFYWAALATGFLAVMLRRVLLSKMQMSLVVQRGAGAVISRLSTTSIICGALGEAVGILGLVATLLTGDTDFNWRLGVVSLLLVGYSFPRRLEWERFAAAAQSSADAATAPAKKLFT